MRTIIDLVEAAQRTDLNDAFWEWFGDSKVVDPNGNPMVMYHGTSGDIEAFDPDLIGSATDEGLYSRGFYFTPFHGNGLLHMGTAGAYTSSNGGNIIPVYLSIQNPLKVMSANWGRVSADMLKGHDGVIVCEGYGWLKDGPIQEIVAFHPTQIKSIFNKGTWSASDPRIDH